MRQASRKVPRARSRWETPWARSGATAVMLRVLGWGAALLTSYCGSGESHGGTAFGEVGDALSACLEPSKDACARHGDLPSDLTCLCCVCTYACDDIDDCRDKFPIDTVGPAFLKRLRCRDTLPVCAGSKRGVCEVACEADTDCEAAIEDSRCLNGFCRRTEERTQCSDGRVLVPGDGSDAHPDLCFDPTEVTVADYNECESCSPTDKGNAYEAANEQLPIDFVTVEQALLYCESRNARLPTLAEWRWAATNGTRGSEYPWGGWSSDELDMARVCSEDEIVACPVGSHPDGNTLTGLADIAGNLAEFVLDEDSGEHCAAGGSFQDARGDAFRPEVFTATSCVVVIGDQATKRRRRWGFVA